LATRLGAAKSFEPTGDAAASRPDQPIRQQGAVRPRAEDMREGEAPLAALRAVEPGSAPASLYFQPHLVADENGFATIEFMLPAVESEYRLLIDAVGSGRIGSAEALIVGQEE
jgi:hypothetical protein